MNFGGMESDSDTGIIDVVTTDGIFRRMGSGLGLDVAKRHTGVCIVQGGTAKREGFSLIESTEMYPLRKDLKSKLTELIGGMEFRYCVKEDIYGGDNYDTVRKLAELDTVIDELIDEGVIKVGHFFRWGESKWLKYFRRYCRMRGGLKAKLETQKILEYLCDGFYMANSGLSEAEKRKIFFEDKCDATAMLCAVPMYLKEIEEGASERKRYRLSDIQIYYIEDLDEYGGLPDERVGVDAWQWVDADWGMDLERKLLLEASLNPIDILIMETPPNKLGRLAVERGLKFHRGKEGYLVWYVKKEAKL